MITRLRVFSIQDLFNSFPILFSKTPMLHMSVQNYRGRLIVICNLFSESIRINLLRFKLVKLFEQVQDLLLLSERKIAD